jgi:hypothetical protein
MDQIPCRSSSLGPVLRLGSVSKYTTDKNRVEANLALASDAIFEQGWLHDRLELKQSLRRVERWDGGWESMPSCAESLEKTIRWEVAAPASSPVVSPRASHLAFRLPLSLIFYFLWESALSRSKWGCAVFYQRPKITAFGTNALLGSLLEQPTCGFFALCDFLIKPQEANNAMQAFMIYFLSGLFNNINLNKNMT